MGGKTLNMALAQMGTHSSGWGQGSGGEDQTAAGDHGPGGENPGKCQMVLSWQMLALLHCLYHLCSLKASQKEYCY